MTIQDTPDNTQPQNTGYVGDKFKRVRQEVGFTTIRAVADHTRFTYEYLVAIENNEKAVTRKQLMNIIGQVRCAAQRANRQPDRMTSNHPTARDWTKDELATSLAAAQTLGHVLWNTEDDAFYGIALENLIACQTEWTWRLRVLTLSRTLDLIRRQVTQRYPIRDSWIFTAPGLEVLPR